MTSVGSFLIMWLKFSCKVLTGEWNFWLVNSPFWPDCWLAVIFSPLTCVHSIICLINYWQTKCVLLLANGRKNWRWYDHAWHKDQKASNSHKGTYDGVCLIYSFFFFYFVLFWSENVEAFWVWLWFSPLIETSKHFGNLKVKCLINDNYFCCSSNWPSWLYHVTHQGNYCSQIGFQDHVPESLLGNGPPDLFSPLFLSHSRQIIVSHIRVLDFSSISQDNLGDDNFAILGNIEGLTCIHTSW